MKDAGIERDSDTKEGLLRIAGEELARRPFAAVSLADLADAAGVSATEIERYFSDMTSVGDAILDRERSSMRDIMARLHVDTARPSQKLVRAFELVGMNLRRDPVVRAGVRIAAESRDDFPHRRLDPFATWQTFVVELLEAAVSAGELHVSAGLDQAARVLVAAGMGTKDLIAFHGSWETAPAQMASTARVIVDFMRRSEPARAGA